MGIKKELAVSASGDRIILNIHEDGVKFQRMLQIIAVTVQCNEYFNKENTRNHTRGTYDYFKVQEELFKRIYI